LGEKERKYYEGCYKTDGMLFHHFLLPVICIIFLIEYFKSRTRSVRHNKDIKKEKYCSFIIFYFLF